MKTAVVQVCPGIERDGEAGYTVRLCMVDEQGSESGDGAEEFMPRDWRHEDPPVNPNTGEPFDAGTLRDWFLAEQSPSPLFRELGTFLFRLLVRGSVHDRWKALRDKGNGNFRTILDIRPDELAALPWELMCDHPYWPFANTQIPISRGQISPGAQASTSRWPIRVLVVVGCREEERIRWKDELLGIKKVLLPLAFAVDLEVLQQPSRDQLVRTFQRFRPDIFHFIGHGSHGLDLHDGVTLSSWSEDEIIADLEGIQPSIAVLNACHSANDHQGGQAISKAFTRLGTRAVLGIYGEIRGDAAARFGAELYRALAASHPIDAAVALARTAVSRIPGDDGFLRRDWSLPSLIVSAPPDQILPISPSLARRAAEIRDIPEFREIRDFVDRAEQRRTIWRYLSAPEPGMPDAPEPRMPDLIMITGPKQAGLSAMLRWCLRACALHGHRVLFRDFGAGSTMTFVNLVRTIVEGDPSHSSAVRRSLESEAFSRFSAIASHLEGAGGGTVPPPVASVRPDRLIPDLFQAFREGLMAACNNEPLTLGLDHLYRAKDVGAEDLKRYLHPEFVSRVAQGQLRPVRLLITATDNEYRDFGLRDMAAGRAVLTVTPFDHKEFWDHFADFQCLVKPPVQQDIAEKLRPTTQLQSWHPRWFNDMYFLATEVLRV